MTVIKFYSDTDSFSDYSKKSKFTDINCIEKGSVQIKKSNRLHEQYRMNVGFSRKEWDDVEGQIKDAIKFLRKYGNEIRKVIRTHKISDVYLDFPSYSKFTKNNIIHQQCFPPPLLSICGKLGVSINLCIYS